jgi:hypothetical protein
MKTREDLERELAEAVRFHTDEYKNRVALEAKLAAMTKSRDDYKAGAEAEAHEADRLRAALSSKPDVEPPLKCPHCDYDPSEITCESCSSRYDVLRGPEAKPTQLERVLALDAIEGAKDEPGPR